MTSRQLSLLACFLGLILLAGGVVLAFQVGDSVTAEEQRAANKEATQVLGALTCERAERFRDTGKPPNLAKDLNAKGFVIISPECQQFVALLGESLHYKEGKVTRVVVGEP